MGRAVAAANPSTELLWTPGVCNTVSQKTCKQYSWGCECPQSGTTVQYNNDTHLTLQIAKILVEEGTILNPMATPKDYLNTFHVLFFHYSSKNRRIEPVWAGVH